MDRTVCNCCGRPESVCENRELRSNSELSAWLNANDLERIRQWFSAVQDVSPRYLECEDYLLARRIYEKLNMRVPNSVIDGGA